jgi:type VI secretion system protein
MVMRKRHSLNRRLSIHCGTAVLCALFVPLLAACVSPTIRLHTKILPTANMNSAIRMDLVFTENEETAQILSGLSARDWFSKRDQLKRDYPKAAALEFYSWEVMPGQSLPLQIFRLQGRPLKGYVFASYETPGEHRVSITGIKTLLVTLENQGFRCDEVTTN